MRRQTSTGKSACIMRSKSGKFSRPARTGTRSQRTARCAWILMLPSLAGTMVFLVLPLFDVIRRAFSDGMGKRFVGGTNFRRVWENKAFRLAAFNTLKYEGVCIPLLLLVSLLLALLVNRECLRADKRAGRSKAAGMFEATLALPMAIPVASMVLVWKILLCPEGVWNQVLTAVSGAPWERDWVNEASAFSVLVVTYLWKNAGYDMLLWLAGLRAIPTSLYEAARVDGAGALAAFWYITLPGLRGSAGMIAVLTLVNSFQVFREAYLLAGGYPQQGIYLIQHLFNHWFLNLDVQMMCAASVLIVGSCLGLFAIGRGLRWAVRHGLR